MPTIRHTRLARRDLISIWLDVQAENPAAADRLLLRLEARIAILLRFPEAGRVRPEIDAEARVLVERPYLVFYRIIPDGMEVVRVLHGARDIDPTFFQEGIR